MAAANVDQLRSRLRGELLQPGDAGYDDARKVYNGMIDPRPRLLARCRDAADVISCIGYERENDLLTAIRGRSHNGVGSEPAMTAWWLTSLD